MMNIHLQKKVSQAVKLLQVCYKTAGEPLEIAYSGGKDSDVILELAKMSGIEYRAIYKNTTIDPPGTIKHAKENGVEIRRPKESFFSLMMKHGFPNRFTRFCCSVLKEYKILDNCVIGIRKCESVNRAKRYTEPTECRIYGKKNHVNAIYPILDWSDEDELEFIKERGIKLHPLYYSEDGSIDITKRLGCMCCPLAYYKKRLLEFKKYPGMVKAYLRCGEEFLKSRPESKLAKQYSDVYEYFVANAFFDSQRNYAKAKLGEGMLSDKPNYKKQIEDYFHITLTDYTL